MEDLSLHQWHRCQQVITQLLYNKYSGSGNLECSGSNLQQIWKIEKISSYVRNKRSNDNSEAIIREVQII